MKKSTDMTERKRSEGSLTERLRFETLLSNLSARFVKVPADQVGSEIEDTQRQLCEFLRFDSVALWLWSETQPRYLTLGYLYRPSGRPPLPARIDAQEYFPWGLQQLKEGKVLAVSSTEDVPPEAARDQETWRQYSIKSTLVIPLSTGREEGPVLGALAFSNLKEERTWPEPLVTRLQLIAQIFANALERKRIRLELEQRLREIEELKQRLENENLYLHEEVELLADHTEIVSKSLAMKKVLSQAEQVARTDSTVLIQGETGTGKELLARAIHKMSMRKDRSLIAVNCASLPPTLIESELFGREKGAYTGAMTKMIGRFEIADGSTLFLDEIGELPLELQSKLLRVLEEGSFERLGSTKTLHVNVRIIASTNRNLEQEMKNGNFRNDLFYRLSVFPIVIPPLRERPEDIPLLVWAFIEKTQKRIGKEIETISKKTMETLQSYSWPGNVRELKNVIEHAMILSKDKSLHVHLPRRGSFETDVAQDLHDMERRHIQAVLEKTGWRLGGDLGAAEALGLKRTTLHSKMKKLGIKRPNK